MKLNSNVALREFENGIIYLENQVTHLKAWLNGNDAKIIKNLSQQEAGVNDNLLDRLYELWFVDKNEDDSFHTFSYSNKNEIENLSAIDNPWEKTLYPYETPWLNNLQIELTDSCNERCIHCYMPNSLKDKSEEMNFDTISDILKQYRAMNGVKVVLSGGEIFLHKDLFKILELCRNLDLFILLQTNLLVLTQGMLDKLQKLNIFNIQVSLYSTNPIIHDAITKVKGSCARTMSNIQRLVANDIPVLIACPVMKQNFCTIEDIWDFAAGLNIEVYFDYIMMAQSDGATSNLEHRISLSQTRAVIDFMLDRKPEFNKSIKEATSLDKLISRQFVRRRNVCRILSSGLCIAPDGTVYPCPGWKGFNMGNINDNSLKYIWEKSEKAKQLRGIDMDNDFEKCHGCNLRNFCDMCAVYNYNEHADMLHVCKRFCEVAAIFRQAVIDEYNKSL